MIKISLKYAGILGLVAVICTLVVSSMQVVVDPIIVERTIQKVKDNLKQIFSDSQFEYSEKTEEFRLDKNEYIDALYEVTLPDGSHNYVYEMSPKGRNADILFLIAYDTNGAVVKIQYVQMRETKGRGDKITKEKYLENIYMQSASSMNVDMITGATYSSGAMKQSIETSCNHLINEVLK
jgi:Na+-translocating ferredoxin:NAD+ oxidoreductase subunit G